MIPMRISSVRADQTSIVSTFRSMTGIKMAASPALRIPNLKV